ncbi:urease accessory protein [Acetivibrio thermocellus AD2]|jgi:urease accessory protein|uniref:Urease accessory protein n=1 Tax=Acetivibrio thermocellus AD2 TaxID=1138384 RepID=A0AB36TKW8_ACETH|nr:hypothetical protein AD2_02517 [Acetivibrio thermocellus AD2]ANV77257.1 hypothetical protein LQRI_2516 [Acetivibrio thermocellus DSM 2360]EIC04627.1 hypothetical protein YSBL_1803 [Acetivibrio thermocellus YS]PFH03780.1 urease accessory protein [Acetivibrio thermocellus AD2]
MIVERVLYNIKDIDLEKLEVDFVDIEWYEVQKKNTTQIKFQRN